MAQKIAAPKWRMKANFGKQNLIFKEGKKTSCKVEIHLGGNSKSPSIRQPISKFNFENEKY